MNSKLDVPLSVISSQMMAAQQRPSSRWGPSGAWNRLKTGPVDPLESYGLPSKGETRLNDFKAQEIYYSKIVERYMKFCAASGGGDELDKQFAALSLNTTPPSTSAPSAPPALPSKPTPPLSSSRPSGGGAPKPAPSPTAELATILIALRKLREAIIATDRRDTFAQRAYIFNIHAAILTKDWESYQPALLSLLYKIHPHTPLPAPDLHEFVGYWVLDLACRQSDLMTAHAARAVWGYKDRRVEMVLKALAHDDWVGFWKMRRSVDGYQKRVMEWAEDGVRLHALKCLGRSYMTADRMYVERCTGKRWEDLVKDGVGWELVEEEKVVIRRPKVK